MSVKGRSLEETRLLASYPEHLIKRCRPGESSGWDDRPFRERHATLAQKSAIRRKERQK